MLTVEERMAILAQDADNLNALVENEIKRAKVGGEDRRAREATEADLKGKQTRGMFIDALAQDDIFIITDDTKILWRPQGKAKIFYCDVPVYRMVDKNLGLAAGNVKPTGEIKQFYPTSCNKSQTVYEDVEGIAKSTGERMSASGDVCDAYNHETNMFDSMNAIRNKFIHVANKTSFKTRAFEDRTKLSDSSVMEMNFLGLC